MPFRCKDCGKEFPSKRKGIPGECDDPTRNPQGCPIERVSDATDSDSSSVAERQSANSNDGASLLLKHLSNTTRAFLRWESGEEELRPGSIIGRNGMASAKLRADVSVSREHARIDLRDGAWWLENVSKSESPLSLDSLVILPQRGTIISPGEHEVAIGTAGLRLTLEIR